jgi:hypothetical protein
MNDSKTPGASDLDSPRSDVDRDILALGSGLFDSLPPAPMPLFELEDEDGHAPLPLRRRRDTLSPASVSSRPDPIAAEPTAKPAVHGARSRFALQALNVVAIASVSAAIGVTLAHRFGRSAVESVRTNETVAAVAAARPEVAAPAAVSVADTSPPTNPAVPVARAEVAAALTAPPAAPARPLPVEAKVPRAANAATPANPATPATAATPAPVADGSLADMPVIPALPPPPTVAFDRGAAAVAIASASRGISCGEGEGTLLVPVSVTFGANGRVRSAQVTGGALAGTGDGACVAKALRAASVPVFDGEPVTVNTTVRVR